MYEILLVLAAFVFVYSSVAGGLERTPFSGALLFAAFGALCGSPGLGWLDLDVTAEGVRALAEVTLAVVLFTDAANADLGVLRKDIGLPRRLLLVGLPLTILLGIALGMLVLDGLTLLEIAVLSTMLAPTDAALGKAVVTNPAVPEHIRESLNAESGLNDGICVPILFVFLALATGGQEEGGTTALALKLVAEEIGIGLAVGVVFTLAGSWLLRHCADRGWVTESWLQLPVVALAGACFAGAQLLGGSGFIACFAGGILAGWVAKNHKHRLLLAAEGTGDTLALITWVVFGAAVLDRYVGQITWQTFAYAILSLTVIRMLPVYLVLAGTGLSVGDKLFMGWFGPRGLASIVFGVIVLQEDLPGGPVIAVAVFCTILLSVIAHGLTANPLAAALGGGRRPEPDDA